ncbi:MAG: hypothetical protein COX79_02905 [Candidatus Levybacteria bacterium CG_4_10_14_0_2_um_filter_36_16]|nr:MAG: hypothetical protein AUK12_01125 [Candidatus Levybacteria bacterium CG2_30_37_29]PIR79584.1 MAG: hypothetical protein COU26_00325 [Candidatus Levybacteria bacterium CG10_big_fil_rev_8_21_14_0_10_36_30]PIZ97274.1 MAG: hypothetical protein COX79_02905 [Candidatus Levybacteria bacterium CG_4_10_14_0_2_um_filter_36_16]PJA90946.1 MAG: hypothetical protein CO136_00065 [Candidatus Levybacteria bacterium CG_4_9_14_3_um_filter_36_7]
MAKKSETNKNNVTMLILAISLAVGFLGGYFMARTKYKAQLVIVSEMVSQRDTIINSLKAKSNRVMMVNGEMMMEKDGEVRRMEKSISTADETTVDINGSVTKKDGSQTMMKDGDSMMIDSQILQ